MSSSGQVLLYNGRGAGTFCTYALKESLQSSLDPNIYRISEVTSLFPWQMAQDPKSVKAFFVGGGSAAEMAVEAVPGQNPDRVRELSSLIRQTIEDACIPYHGTCAGALVAAGPFHERTALGAFPDKPVRYLGLDLYPEGGFVPLDRKPGRGLSVDDVKVCNVSVPTLKEPVPVVNIFGPGFFPREDATILGSYIFPPNPDLSYTVRGKTFSPSDGQIVESIYYHQDGKAPVILEGSHLEIQSKLIRGQVFKSVFRPKDDAADRLAETLVSTDEVRATLFRDRLGLLKLRCL